jgi:hypothetical protein
MNVESCRATKLVGWKGKRRRQIKHRSMGSNRYTKRRYNTLSHKLPNSSIHSTKPLALSSESTACQAGSLVYHLTGNQPIRRYIRLLICAHVYFCRKKKRVGFEVSGASRVELSVCVREKRSSTSCFEGRSRNVRHAICKWNVTCRVGGPRRRSLKWRASGAVERGLVFVSFAYLRMRNPLKRTQQLLSGNTASLEWCSALLGDVNVNVSVGRSN